MNSTNTPTLTQSAKVRFRRDILQGGVVVRSSGWTPNLILDSGLELMATKSNPNLFSVLVLGTGTTPTKRDSGTVTASKTGATVTSSAAFFEAADVGRIIRFDSSPTEFKISTFTSSTSVSVSGSGDVPSGEFTVWYVNETNHGAEFQRVNTYATDAGMNQRTFAVDTFTYRRTFLSPTFATARVIKELGWSDSTTAAAPLLGRALVPGGGDSVSAGQQYRVQVEITEQFGPRLPVDVTDIGTGGFNTAGQFVLESVAKVQTVHAAGSSGNDISEYNCLAVICGVGGLAKIGLSTDATALRTLSETQLNVVGGLESVNYNAAAEAYVPASCRRVWAASFGANTGNGNVKSITWGPQFYGGTYNPCARLLLTNAQTKDNLHKLTVKFALQWGRVLAN